MRKASTILVLIIAAFTLTGLNLVQAQQTTIYIDPTPVIATVSSEFTVAVNIMDVPGPPLGGITWYDFGFSFDPNLLECISVSEGPFLASGGPTTWFPPTIDNVVGSIYADCLLQAPGSVSGSGTLAYVTFHCKGAGSCDLIFWDAFTSIGPVDIIVNGHVQQEVSPAVGGEWVPINTVQMLVQIVGSAAAMSAIVASFVGFKRIKRKQN